MNIMVGRMGTNEFSYRDWLRRALAQKGVTQSELARLWGKTPDIVSRILLGKRKLSADELAEIARLLQVAPPLANTDPKSFSSPVSPNSDIIPLGSSSSVPIIGIVEAGAFRPLSWFDDADLGEVMNGYDPRFPKDLQKGWLVRGDDNEAAGIRDGDQIVTVDPWQAGISIASGSMVLVEQRSADASTRELTLKELQIHASHIALIPKTNDKRFKALELPLDADLRNGPTRIIGVVVAAVRRFPQQFVSGEKGVLPVVGGAGGSRLGKAVLAAAMGMALTSPCNAEALSLRPFWHQHADGSLHLHEGHTRADHENEPLHQGHRHLFCEVGVIRDRKAALVLFAAQDKKTREAFASDTIGVPVHHWRGA